jgi:glycosyltransferase involved in cell wall biosynthesis
MKLLVSILIPAYNAEKWISDTIRSALGQTWERKEVIIVDDGSTDRTLAVAKQFESGLVRVVTQENQGASAARNKAFSLSCGDYVQWLDADDLLASDKIERQMEALGPAATPRTLLASSWGQFMYRPHRARFRTTSLWRDLTPVQFLLCKLKDCVFMQTSAWLVSRHLSESAGAWDTTMLSDDDGEYFCRVVLASDAVRFVPESRAFYRDTGGSSLSSVGSNDKKLEALWRSKQLHINYLLSLEDSERTRAASVQYLQHYLPFYYPFRPDIAEEMRRFARDLGGELKYPHMAWKYELLRRLVGWNNAKHAQLRLSRFKWAVIREWDKAMFRKENCARLEK